MHVRSWFSLISRLYVFVLVNLSIDAFVFGHLCLIYILLQWLFTTGIDVSIATFIPCSHCFRANNSCEWLFCLIAWHVGFRVNFGSHKFRFLLEAISDWSYYILPNDPRWHCSCSLYGESYRTSDISRISTKVRHMTAPVDSLRFKANWKAWRCHGSCSRS